MPNSVSLKCDSVGLPELEKQEYAFIEPQSIGIDGQLMLQASGLNHHNG